MYADIVNSGIIMLYGDLSRLELVVTATHYDRVSGAYVLETDVVEGFSKMQETIGDVIWNAATFKGAARV